ncbi:helix-turn-helix transcriptional regulator [Dyadobacter sediminis]|uniref:Helix-turn-helix transcriptional regulator n=1 Tax=Dyadobacter sediminis TaxID=1493691 RepID=A0A5R9KL17_9BACT|nr:helix-turn-helix transcriptional regulator [Dyadobacter sediminis]
MPGFLVSDCSYKRIAAACGISCNTVNNPIRNSCDKLYVTVRRRQSVWLAGKGWWKSAAKTLQSARVTK